MNLWIHGNRRSVSGITLKFLCKSKYFWQCYVTKTWVLFWTCPSWFFQMQCFRNWTVSIIWCKRGKVLLHAVLQITMATSMLPALTLKSSSSFCPLSVFIYFIRFSQLVIIFLKTVGLYNGGQFIFCELELNFYIYEILKYYLDEFKASKRYILKNSSSNSSWLSY